MSPIASPARTLLRFAVSIGLLALLAGLMDVDVVLARLRGLESAWVAGALAITVGQGLLLAWRWRATARLLGVALPFRDALTEYYLGNFLNQVLPGGVAGDVTRAWRHARTEVPTGPAVRAVVLERASAQVVMTTVALISVALLPGLPGGLRVLFAAGALAVVGAAAVAVARPAPPSNADLLPSDAEVPSSARPPWSFLLRTLLADARRAVLAPVALRFQATTAILVVGTYIGVYLMGARALGVETPTTVLAPLVAPVLMTMLLPVSVAGWGLREAGAAALWAAVGLAPEDGVAISVTYGVLVLLSTAPGALVLIGGVGRDRDRRGRRLRARRSGQEGGAPR